MNTTSSSSSRNSQNPIAADKPVAGTPVSNARAQDVQTVDVQTVHPQIAQPAAEKEAFAALVLSPQQRMAINWITSGNTLIASASAAGVSRMTLYRWLKHDANFQAAYNAWQQDCVISARTRLVALNETAMATVAREAKIDAKVALAVLKATGVLQLPPAGSTDPEEIEKMRIIERTRSEAKLGEEMFFASLGGIAGKPPSAEKLIEALEKSG